eukprot:532529_1
MKLILATFLMDMIIISSFSRQETDINCLCINFNGSSVSLSSFDDISQLYYHNEYLNNTLTIELSTYTNSCNVTNSNYNVSDDLNTTTTQYSPTHQNNETEIYWLQEWIELDVNISSLNHDSCMIAAYNYSVSDDIIQLIGGCQNFASDTLHTFRTFNLSSETLHTIGSLPGGEISTEWAGSSILLHNNLYFTSQISYSANDFYVYNMINNSVITAGNQYPKPYQEILGECYTTDGERYIYLLGGYNSFNDFMLCGNDRSAIYGPEACTFSFFDTFTSQWVKGPNMSWPKSNGGCVYNKLNSMIYFISPQYSKWWGDIQKYSVQKNQWEELDVKVANYNAEGWTAVMPKDNSDSMIIIGDLWQCKIFRFSTEQIYPCPVTYFETPYTGVYIPHLQQYYLFGTVNFTENWVQVNYTISIKYAKINTTSPFNIMSSSAIITNITQRVPIIVTVNSNYRDVLPDNCNFTVFNSKLGINNTIKILKISHNNSQCFICDSVIYNHENTTEYCWNCSIGLYIQHQSLIVPGLNETYYIQGDGIGYSGFYITLDNVQSINLSASNAALSPGNSFAIKFDYYILRSNMSYQFTILSLPPVYINNILTIQTTDTEISSCTIGSLDNSITTSCSDGVSPIIDYDYISPTNNTFNISIVPYSENSKNITIFPKYGIVMTVTGCESGYGMKNKKIATCELCAYDTFALKSGILPCHHCADHLDGITCKGVNTVIISHNYWLSAFNRMQNELYPFINITENDDMFSAFCPAGYCCTKRKGCNYLHEYQLFNSSSSTALCSVGRNVSTPLCGSCQNEMSELFGSTSCGICTETNYTIIIILIIFYFIPFTIYIAYYESVPTLKKSTKHDKEISIFKTLIFDIAIYYFQAMSIIFSSKGITVSTFLETLIISIFNLQP